jgi:hypothetical protein
MQGITVVDDNDPFPENAIPAQNEAQRIYQSVTWTTPRACCRRSDGFAYPEGKFVNNQQILSRLYVPPLQVSPVWQRVPLDC